MDVPIEDGGSIISCEEPISKLVCFVGTSCGPKGHLYLDMSLEAKLDDDTAKVKSNYETFILFCI